MEIRGYTCDGGCGATTALDGTHDSLARHGWSITFTPHGSSYPTLYTCSFICLIRVCTRLEARDRVIPAVGQQ